MAGAVIAFVFNVPMRAIERQLDGIHKQGLRRVLSIVLTIAALALVIMFVVEMLAPQIQVTVAALTERIPTFICHLLSGAEGNSGAAGAEDSLFPDSGENRR